MDLRRKSIITCLAPVLAMMLVGCVTTRDVVLDSDYSYKGRFNRYRTFSFMADESTDAFDCNPIVQKVIQSRLGAMGYQREEASPDLLITYKFFYDKVDFLVYNQPDFNQWVESTYGAQLARGNPDSIALVADTKKVKEPEDSSLPESQGYDPIKTPMLEGMIFLSFYDTRRNEHVWSGYMSGVFRDTNSDNEVFLKSSIGKIMDEYKVLARGYKSAK